MVKVGILAAAVGVASAANLPEHFDVRSKWIGCGSHVVDQGQCGSCWAAAASSTFGDRLCIFFGDDGTPLPKNGLANTNRLFQKPGSCTGEGTTHMAHNHGCKRTGMFVSAQALVSCGTVTEDKHMFPQSAGCNGGEAVDAWRYFFIYGLTEMTADQQSGCTPYTSGKCLAKDPHNNGCKVCTAVWDQCVDTGLSPKRWRAKSWGFIQEKGLKARADTSKPRTGDDVPLLKKQVRAMQEELFQNGPLTVCIDYYDNFGTFFNDQPLGIYNSTDGTIKSGGHCLNLIGWGTDEVSGLDYWLIKNSWGEGWGNQGVFRLVRGQDLIGVESDVWAGCPDGSNCELTAGVTHKEMEIPKGAKAPILLRRFEELGLDYAEERRRLDEEPAAEPSTTWKSGYWNELTREEFCTKSMALKVAHAFEEVYGTTTSPEIACNNATRVWVKSGMAKQQVRVEFQTGKESLREIAPNGHHRAL
mmetsp:Transcript_19225/g.32023  ORF Transcript_19225/g.32023 Transcript_19225/m.32023 type:complete len:472 (+) Transcript_19225:64-1479(+)